MEASDRIFDILCDLRGFYLKLGQILATKTEMLPEPYINSLRRLLDKMPPVHFKKVWMALALVFEVGIPVFEL